MKNVVFLDVTACGSCNNRRFGGIDELGTFVAIVSTDVSEESEPKNVSNN
jgi:hypothetical protein